MVLAHRPGLGPQLEITPVWGKGDLQPLNAGHDIEHYFQQDALLELKTAIKASGEHKQRVIIHIAVDGLKIRDEKTGVSWSFQDFTI